MFYERFCSLCAKSGVSPSFAAQQCGVSRMSVTRWKNGAVPSSDIVRRLAEYFAVSTDYLLGTADARHDDTAPSPPVMIPIVGDVAAGAPIVAEENIEGYAVSDTGDPRNYFYLRVRGDSMINAGIKNGGLVLIKKQSIAANNQIVACIVGGDSATLKRYYQTDTSVTLVPENPLYQPITLPLSAFENGEAAIIGVGVRVVTDL